MSEMTRFPTNPEQPPFDLTKWDTDENFQTEVIEIISERIADQMLEDGIRELPVEEAE